MPSTACNLARITTAALALLLHVAAAHAQIRIGVDLSTTGPAAAIGASSRNAILLWPKQIGGQAIEYVFLDDGSDPGNAVRNARKLISEDKVDLIVGPNTSPAALAMIDAVAESQTPMIALAASAAIVQPIDARRAWVFKMPQNDSHMATIVTQHMADHGVHSVGFIGFADAYGEGWWREFSRLAEVRKLNVVASERYARNDTSVTGQVLKLIAAHPDAILIAASSTPAVLPQKTLNERGYRGQIYQTHGIATPEFLRVGASDVEGTLFPTGPAVVARGLPDSNPVKRAALAFTQRYEASYGAGSVTQFAADAWGAGQLIGAALPVALRVATPGTPAFRAALRNAIEQTRDLAVPQGVINMSATDHVGLDQRSRVMGKVEKGRFAYAFGG
ncbi:MAG: ABC transporter substrate-binding protein [Pseudomonadota bacterium]|nr:ABC transporter substrate-binding protein [Pseudomonadota bacterium]